MPGRVQTQQTAAQLRRKVLRRKLSKDGTSGFMTALVQHFHKAKRRAIKNGAVGAAAVCLLLSAAGFAGEAPSRWVANPFAGTLAIEVEHVGGGEKKIHHIREPETVRQLLAELKIHGIKNGTALKNIPPAYLVFHKKDGTSVRAAVNDAQNFSLLRGIAYVDPAFVAALNRHLTKSSGTPVKLEEHLPSPARKPEPPFVHGTAQSLQAGFASLELTYFFDRGIRKARITEPKVLDELHQSLRIIKHDPITDEKPQNVSFWVVLKDGSRMYCQFLNQEQFFDFKAGRFTIAPSFVKALNVHIGKLEGREIDLLAKPSLAKEQITRGEEFRKLLSSVESIRCVLRPEAPILVDRPEAAARLVQALKWVEVPTKEWKLQKSDQFIELTMKDGKKLTLTFLNKGENNANIPAGPALADLVDVTNFGQVWLDNQWKYGFEHYAYELEREAEGRRHDETTAHVCRDLGGFFRQVISMDVYWDQGDEHYIGTVSRDDCRKALDTFQIEKVERLNWSDQRWRDELDKLTKRKAGYVVLTPGFGFSLDLQISGEREMLVTGYGRVVFKSSPIPAIQKAAEPDPRKTRGVQLLPR